MSTKKIYAVGKLLFTFGIIYLSYHLFTNEGHWIFIDGANLMFHEAGHWIFFPFGRFMNILGGSLFQCLLPLGILFYFFYTRQFFSSVFCLFWLGDNLINVSVYISDASTRALPLLGGDGVIHDWWWILSTLHLLAFDHLFGSIVFFFGVLCVVFSVIFLFLLSFKQLVE